nr:hypothetical protein [Tanacetum cinerariifolium]
MCEMVCQIVQKKQEEKRIEEEQAANARYWKIPACCDDDDDDDVDYTIAITPVLSTEEPVDSLSMGDKHLDTIPATESNEVIKSSVEDLVPIPSEFEENIEYVEASPHNSELVSLEAAAIVIPKVEEIENDNLSEKLLNVHLLIANIEALKENPTPSSEILTKSSSTPPKSFLEETNTFHNSLPEFENFYFDLEEISSGSTTTHSDISLSEYDSFTFDLSNDQFPPSDRSDFSHVEFTDELAHIISPPEYDCFYFRDLPDPGELISIFNSEIRENLFTTCVNLSIEDDHSPLLTYVVWIFLAYLTYPIIPPYLYPFENEDTIFDPGITINHVYSFKPGLSHRCGAFKKFNTHRSHLNECPMIINGKNTPILDVKDKQKKDKIGSKPDKNGKRGEAEKSQKQLQSRKKEKIKKMQVEGPKMQTLTELLKKEEIKGLNLQFNKRRKRGARSANFPKLYNTGTGYAIRTKPSKPLDNKAPSPPLFPAPKK